MPDDAMGMLRGSMDRCDFLLDDNDRLRARVAELEAERDRLIDSHIADNGVGFPLRYTAFPDEARENSFNSKEEAVRFVRRYVGLDGEG